MRPLSESAGNASRKTTPGRRLVGVALEVVETRKLPGERRGAVARVNHLLDGDVAPLGDLDFALHSA